MRVLRRRRQLVAWVAIFGLILNLAVGMQCCMPLADGVDPLTVLDPSVICRHDDAALPAIDDGRPQPPPKPCSLCLVAAATAAAALILALSAILGPSGARWRHAYDFIRISFGDLRRAGLQSRAPPLPA
jgi:hypothetical protein